MRRNVERALGRVGEIAQEAEWIGRTATNAQELLPEGPAEVLDAVDILQDVRKAADSIEQMTMQLARLLGSLAGRMLAEENGESPEQGG